MPARSRMPASWSGRDERENAMSVEMTRRCTRSASDCSMVIIPREGRQVIATVESRGEERLEVGGATVPAYHLVVQPAVGHQLQRVGEVGRGVFVDHPGGGRGGDAVAGRQRG